MRMTHPAGSRSMRDWLDDYSQHHRHPVNRVLHWICVPLAMWGGLALLWTVPVPTSLLRPGAWAVLAIVPAFAWYWKRSRRLGTALLVAWTALALVCAWTFAQWGPSPMRRLAAALCVAACIGSCIGYLFERRRPGCFADPVYLLIGPAWWMDTLLDRFGMGEKP
jgi:uncharacterized membrane protein YGL010W